MKKLIALIALLVSMSVNAGTPTVIAQGKSINQVKMILAKHYSSLPGKSLVIENDRLVLSSTGMFASHKAVTSLISDGTDTMVTVAMFARLDSVVSNVLSAGMQTPEDAMEISADDQKRIEDGLNKLLNN